MIIQEENHMKVVMMMSKKATYVYAKQISKYQFVKDIFRVMSNLEDIYNRGGKIRLYKFFYKNNMYMVSSLDVKNPKSKTRFIHDLD